jgi:radical SAM protein with 4Fe4S-binding SPASM domain
MLDINFYMKFNALINNLNPLNNYSINYIMGEIEKIRSNYPIIYNIETTNRCNMRCKMCPRTTRMTRPIEDITIENFSAVIDQIKPHSQKDWMKWKSYCEERYKINERDMNENHFFLYIISKVIQLHGYGDPLLDKNMSKFISILNKRGLQSYFSCNPANIDISHTYEMMESGLNYIKYSVESIDDLEHKNIRGDKSNFSKSYKAIKQVIKYKEMNNLNTTIIITMLDLNNINQKEKFKKLFDAFKDFDVYIYLKSEDCQWYRKDYHGTNSIHWSEICKHPWMTMTIKSNGEATMCMEDYNNEIILGDTKKSSLKEIWDNEKYRKFRRQHLNAKDNIKCVNECDMKLIGDCYNIS